MNFKPEKIAIIGLGYVGLPLAIALAEHFPCLGFDINPERVKDLEAGHDRTHEIPDENLKQTSLKYTFEEKDIEDADVYIITTPTPIDEKNHPDLGPVMAACKSVSSYLKKGNVVILESTVFPGVTEERCGPELEHGSGLRSGVDFFLGYSPERVNPGDKQHTINKITKVIAGQTTETTDLLETIYGAITGGNIYRARNIKTAEASKVIENAQRDLNIAFINEAAMIFKQADLSIYDVLDAARTKWNFLDFTPGLVGGHCIGVDPYYLTHFAKDLGMEAELIMTGRRTNDAMASFVANDISNSLEKGNRVLVLGLTFKENVPDLRNSKTVDLIWALKQKGLLVDVYDPVADPEEVKAEFGIHLLPTLGPGQGEDKFDAIIGSVAHNAFKELKETDFAAALKKGGLIADIKGLWRHLTFSNGFQRWNL